MEQKFTIIIPVYNKADGIGRCLQSLISQTYKNFEVIIVDDCSTDGGRDIIKSFMRDKRIRAFFLPKNSGRLVARNFGMRLATGDWICWLDADDEYMSNYLEVLNDEINRNQDYKIFNFGMLVKEREIVDNKRFESGWRIVEPLILSEKENGMESFPHGKIGTGSFIYHRDLMWFFPEDSKTPYGGDDSYPASLVKKDKVFNEICKKNESGSWMAMGNPWGDDYTYFWYLTRKNKTKTLNNILYIQHIKK